MPHFIKAENAYAIVIESAQKREWQMAKYHIEVCLTSLETYLNYSNILGDTANEEFLHRCTWVLQNVPNIIIMLNRLDIINPAADFIQVKHIYSLLHRFSLKLNYLQLADYFQLVEQCFTHKLTANEILYIIDELTKFLAVTIPDSQIDEESYRVTNTQIFIALLRKIYNQSNYSNQWFPNDTQSTKVNLVWTGITSIATECINNYKVQLVKRGAIFSQIDLPILLAYLMDKTTRLSESAENLKKKWALVDLGYRYKDKELNALKRKGEMLEKENTVLKRSIEGGVATSLPETSYHNPRHVSLQTSAMAKTFVMPNIRDFNRFAFSQACDFPVRVPTVVFSADLAASIVNLSKIADQLSERFAYFQNQLRQATTLCNYLDNLQNLERERIVALERKNADLKLILASIERSAPKIVHKKSAQLSPTFRSVVRPNLLPLHRTLGQNISPSMLFRPIIVPPKDTLDASPTTLANAAPCSD